MLCCAQVYLENATGITIAGCALLAAGQSAVWMQGWAQNNTITGNLIRESGFCSVCPAVQSEKSFVCGRPERLHVGTEQKAECWPPCASHEGSAHNLLI